MFKKIDFESKIGAKMAKKYAKIEEEKNKKKKKKAKNRQETKKWK